LHEEATVEFYANILPDISDEESADSVHTSDSGYRVALHKDLVFRNIPLRNFIKQSSDSPQQN
jgi:hypothetical protein